MPKTLTFWFRVLLGLAAVAKPAVHICNSLRESQHYLLQATVTSSAVYVRAAPHQVDPAARVNMTHRNSNRTSATLETSYRQQIVSYRRARLQRSLARLRTHPAVNPTGPHGPHGSLPPSLSTSSTAIPSPSQFSPADTSERQSPQSVQRALPGIIPALFNELVRRELGIDSSKNPAASAAGVQSYLSAARAVTSTPSLSDSCFISRLATGHKPNRLKDQKIISSVVSAPTDNPPHIPRAHEIHLAIQKAALRRKAAPPNLPRTDTTQKLQKQRRSTRRRQRSENDTANNPSNPASDRQPTSKVQSQELAAFRPSPEAVRRTRSAAARARRFLTKKTPSECCFCPDPQNFDSEEIDSELIGPFVDRRGNAKLFVHFDCACWAPQVYTDPANGQLRRVYDEFCRGRKLKCSSCGDKGATIGCYIQRCKRVFHYRCLESAKAYRVERFFAAFCENHAHLGRKPSYKILMEAATIADVSAAQRSEDTTYGLDAPHSRYTLLRRRETEIIFSRKWRISSHGGAFDDKKVIFSHRRKLILGKSEKICVGDCVRVLRNSALDIASGRLAFMALADSGEGRDDVSAVEARAAIASRENTGLLLLRNLRRAPQWLANEIEIIRNIPMEVPQASFSLPGEKMSLHSGTDGRFQQKGNAKEMCTPTLSGGQKRSLPEKELADPSQDRGAKKPRRVEATESLNDGLNCGSNQKVRVNLPSERLPSFNRHSLKQTPPMEDGTVNSFTSPVQEIKEKNPHKGHSAIGQQLVTPHQRRAAPDIGSVCLAESSSVMCQTQAIRLTCLEGKVSKINADDPREKRVPQEPVTCSQGESKVKSSWAMFLEEQLPKERLLRPEDPVPDSLRNMARLWSLMTSAERGAYEKRAQSSESMQRSRRSNRGEATLPSRLLPSTTVRPGLFASGEILGSKPSSGLKLRLKTRERHAKRHSSVPISLIKEAGIDEKHSNRPISEPNWDELFPTTLESSLQRTEVCTQGTIKTQNDQVRAPPTRKQKEE